MSETVRVQGFIAKLVKPFSGDEDEYDEFMAENDWEPGLNYEGTLFYVGATQDDIYGLTIGNNLSAKFDIIKDAEKYGLEIDKTSIRPFDCIYYNGGDFPIDELTIEKYNSILEKENA